MLATAVLLGPLAYALPSIPRPFLWEPLVWGLAVLVGYWGFGRGVARVVGRRVDMGLCVAWGMAAVVVLSGPLLALGVLSRSVLLAIVVVGNLLAALSVLTDWPRTRLRGRALVAMARRRPLILAPLVVLLFLGGLQYVASASDLYTNPYDDDIAYLPLIKRLHDIGNLDEPFSFRRISSYGGQTVLGALDLLRGGFANANLFDRGQCFLLVMALFAGALRRARRPAALAMVMGILFLLVQEDLHINLASYFSGVAVFFALYRSQAMALERRGWRDSVPSVLLAATAITLRQNYIPVAVLALVLPHVFAWWEERRATPKLSSGSRLLPVDREALALLLRVGAILSVAVLGYCVAAYRSNRTFLFPLSLGTFNPAMQLKATVPSMVGELKLLFTAIVEMEPLRVLLLVIPAGFALRDGRRGRPLLALLVAAIAGFFLLVHSFTQAGPTEMSRYSFGFLAAAVLAVFAEAASSASKGAPARGSVHAPRLAQVLVWAGLAIQVTTRRAVEAPKHVTVFRNIAQAASFRKRAGDIWPVEADRYARMQATIPTGAKVAILLDEPYLLDFGKQQIANLDMPGYCSSGSRIPSFRGPEALEEYLRGEGFSFVAFVRSDFSRYQYRREFWFERMILTDAEVWRIFSAYILDFMGNLAILSEKHAVLFEERGMVVMDLSKPALPKVTP